MIKSIFTNPFTIVALSNGTTLNVPNDHINIDRIMDTLENTDDEDMLLDLLKGKQDLSQIDTSGLVFEDDGIFYNGTQLHGVLVDTIQQLIEGGFPNLSGMKNFLENLLENPSENSQNELYEFLSYKQLPITEDGCFLAYKSVQLDGYSHHGNTDVTVVSGEVDANGHILNSVGAVIEVPRSEVNDNLNSHCSTGLHVGSLDYAKGFHASNSNLLICKINPRDVVCVPNDSNCQKVRVSRYEVIEPFVEEIVEPQVKVESGGVEESHEGEKRDKVVVKIEKYIDNKIQAGSLFVTLKQIQSSFSPDTPPILTILNAINNLPSNGTKFVFEFDSKSAGKSIVRFK